MTSYPKLTPEQVAKLPAEVQALVNLTDAERAKLRSLPRPPLPRPPLPTAAPNGVGVPILGRFTPTMPFGTFNQQVAAELDKLRVRRAAQESLDVELRGPAPPFDAGTLTEVLARPVDPPHRIEGFLPSGGRLLLVAQRKTGKTTLGLNLGKALLDGKHFLGRFAVRPATGNIAFLNYEVTGQQLAHWAQQVGIPGDRLLLVNLRGRRNPLDHPDDRTRLSELLRRHQVEVLLVDPFSRAYTGKSQNDAGEVTHWLTGLDRFAAETGVSEMILTAHAGWDGERSRGASALEDWPDVVATLVHDPDDEGARYLRAFGRDVEVDEDRLHYEPATRTVTLAGSGSRKRNKAERAVEQAIPDVLDYVAANPDCSGSEIRAGVAHNDKVIDHARQLLVVRREVLEAPRKGRGGGKSYRLAEPRPSQANPGQPGYGTPATPVYREPGFYTELPTDQAGRGSEAAQPSFTDPANPNRSAP